MQLLSSLGVAEYGDLALNASLTNISAWKGENNNFTVEMPGKHYLNQVIKINIIGNVMWIIYIPWYDEKGISPLKYSF